MNFSSKTTHTSEVMPEVSFSLKKLSHGRRVKIDLALCDHRATVREFAAEFAALPDGDAETTETELAKLKIDQSTRLVIEQHFKPTYIREALASIEGLEIDELPAKDAEALLAEGPAELVEEIYQTIQRNIGLGMNEAKN